MAAVNIFFLFGLHFIFSTTVHYYVFITGNDEDGEEDDE